MDEYLELTSASEIRADIQALATPERTLRDDFAAAALPIVAPGNSPPHCTVHWCVRPEQFDQLARDAYAVADAMLKARQS